MDTKSIYLSALKNNYALGAFNFVNLDMLKAIISGAKNCKSPVILQVSEGALDFFGDQYLAGIIKVVRQNAEIPVIFHLDHGKSFEVCERAIEVGFDSVMIDASALTFENNILETKKVVDYAHNHGVWVEAELGKLQGIEDNVSSEVSVYTNPEEARLFVEKTGCDSLAIAIGTSHGAYKFSGEPTLRFDILSEIEKLLPDFPLVLHGASSIPQDTIEKINKYGGKITGAKGIPEEFLEIACREHNIIKINMDSDLRLQFTAEIRKCLSENPENFDLRKYIKPAMNEVTALVEEKINFILNSANKA